MFWSKHRGLLPSFRDRERTKETRNVVLLLKIQPTTKERQKTALTVCPREEAERSVVARYQVLRQDSPQPDDVGHDVAMGQHHPLRLSRGTGGIDKSGQFFGVWQIGRHLLVCWNKTNKQKHNVRRRVIPLTRHAFGIAAAVSIIYSNQVTKAFSHVYGP